jgi:hypothetical protein
MRPTLVVALAAVFAAPASRAEAQGYPFSQRGVVSQMVAFTEITVRYGRPVARGRILFADSGLVPYGKVWHPGADSATQISFSHDVLVEGQPVKAGEYSLWLLPRNGAPWTVILSRAAHVFHTPYPGPDRDALRVDAAPERTAHMESMAIYFPVVLRDESVMRIHWGEVALPIKIKAPWRPPDDR